MNFAQAVKGRLTRSATVGAIQSQAETELGRKLKKEEEDQIFSHSPPKEVLLQIQKVLVYTVRKTFVVNIV